ncbi:MAG: hydroxymethylpyrimidine/phosphomethylpyrimidine kinase [Muribaculaceae bacterium]|nr:hydroxymethylpyrimidine/phosphomethylpyrimidine kinase [Muribaculaceae bacterium]
MKIKSILTIAGSDSSSGAGIQADCAVARSMRVFPFCVVTCVTSQGKSGVRRIQIVDPEIFRDQLEVAFEEYRPDAVKIGLLPSNLKPILLEMLKKYKPANVVLDPIKAPTLMSKSADDVAFGWSVDELEEFSPYIHYITPNLPEAYDFMGWEFPGPQALAEIYRIGIYQLLPVRLSIPNILIKGGHASEDGNITDVLIRAVMSDGDTDIEYERTPISHKTVDTKNTHGTGCSLSAALTAYLAMDQYNPEMCARHAVAQVHTSLKDHAGDSFFPDPDYCGPAFFTI